MRKRGEIKNPRTRLEDLVEFYKEVKAMENGTFARIQAGIFNKNRAFSFLEEERKKIEERYKGVLDENDRYSFNSLEEMQGFLERLGFDKRKIKEKSKHEAEHYSEALKNGLNNCKLICWLVKDGKKMDYVCQTRVAVNTMIEYEIYQKISHAPLKHSFIDDFCVDYSKIARRGE